MKTYRILEFHYKENKRDKYYCVQEAEKFLWWITDWNVLYFTQFPLEKYGYLKDLSEIYGHIQWRFDSVKDAEKAIKRYILKESKFSKKEIKRIEVKEV